VLRIPSWGLQIEEYEKCVRRKEKRREKMASIVGEQYAVIRHQRHMKYKGVGEIQLIPPNKTQIL
jgi:hypothetical protein